MQVNAQVKEKIGEEVEITDAEAKAMKVAEAEVKKSTEAEAAAQGILLTEAIAGVNHHKMEMRALI